MITRKHWALQDLADVYHWRFVESKTKRQISKKMNRTYLSVCAVITRMNRNGGEKTYTIPNGKVTGFDNVIPNAFKGYRSPTADQLNLVPKYRKPKLKNDYVERDYSHRPVAPTITRDNLVYGDELHKENVEERRATRDALKRILASNLPSDVKLKVFEELL